MHNADCSPTHFYHCFLPFNNRQSQGLEQVYAKLYPTEYMVSLSFCSDSYSNELIT